MFWESKFVMLFNLIHWIIIVKPSFDFAQSVSEKKNTDKEHHLAVDYYR